MQNVVEQEELDRAHWHGEVAEEVGGGEGVTGDTGGADTGNSDGSAPANSCSLILGPDEGAASRRRCEGSGSKGNGGWGDGERLTLARALPFAGGVVGWGFAVPAPPSMRGMPGPAAFGAGCRSLFCTRTGSFAPLDE